MRVSRLSIGFVALIAIGLFGACGTSDEADSAIARAENLRELGSPILAHALEQGSTEKKVRAAIAMGRIQDGGYADALAEGSRDEDPAVRQAALFALGQLGLAEGSRPPKVAVEACLAALDNDDASEASLAVEALGKLAPDDVARTITPLLQHASELVRAQAAHALFRLRFVPVWRQQTTFPPELPDSAVQALREALTDPSAEVRRAAAHACSRYGQPEAIVELEACLKDEDTWVRVFSARSIGRSGFAEALPPLVEMLHDADAHARVEAVNAIVALGGVDRLPSELAGDASHHVRAALALALGAGGDEGEIATLRTLERDDSPTVVAAAIGSLARRLGDGYHAALTAHVEDSRWVIRAAAAAAATHLKASRRSLLDVAWSDSNHAVRLAALEGLVGLPDGPRFIERALAEDDLAMRGTAVGLLPTIDDPAKRLELLISTYESSAGIEWVEVREAIVDAVAETDVGEEDEALLERIVAEDVEFSVRRRAETALRQRGQEPGVTADLDLEPSPFLGQNFAVDPVVVIETDKGELSLRCFAKDAPIHVASFVDLVRNGHYDGLPWHRVVPNFVIQGGDPRGDGWGGAGYLLRDEINQVRYERGTVGMPKAGKDTGGGQLFITHLPTPHLDGNYTVFARVISGLDVVDRIEVGDRILRAYVESDPSE
jgi:cyclophilin family peptidyl-prolyl cis-trans isomerase/HEAT repeat protein